MKKIILFLLAALLVSVNLSAQDKEIRGDGKVITKTISISDYDKISIVGNLELIYEESDAAPFFEIKVDENILSYLDIEVKRNELLVGPKKTNENKKSSYQLYPTLFVIRTNSKNLVKLNSAGRVDTKLNKINVEDKLEINIAGSGTLILDKSRGKYIVANVAGSGGIIADDINLERLSCNVAGTGKAKLSGDVREGDLNVAGSGKIEAFDCNIRDAKANVAGSGDVEVYATSDLKASVAGSGNIFYKGNPQTSSSIMGSGTVKQMN